MLHFRPRPAACAGRTMHDLDTGHELTTIYGRGLVGELRHIAHRPYVVVTDALLLRLHRRVEEAWADAP